jgi:hypothetical protein
MGAGSTVGTIYAGTGTGCCTVCGNDYQTDQATSGGQQMSIETVLAELERLQETIDDQCPVAVTAFAGVRAMVRKSWPRAKRLVFVKHRFRGEAFIHGGLWYRYIAQNALPGARWSGESSIGAKFDEATEPEMIAAMQAHFDAAWQEMTEATE